jgi:DNA-binding transcriptional MerR regulator
VGNGRHKVGTVGRLTGFSPALLRAWEHRHQLLRPERGIGNQRLYTDDDVQVLCAVRQLLDSGRSIGEIAVLGRRALLAAAPAPAPQLHEAAVRSQHAANCLAARLDLTQLIGNVCDTLADDFEAALARIWIYERGENVLYLRASAGLSRRTRGSSRECIDLSAYPYKVGVVARSQEAFVANGLIGDQHFEQGWVAREQLASVAILPLVARGSLQGVLACFFRQPLTEEVVGALGTFAAMTASGIAARRVPVKRRSTPVLPDGAEAPSASPLH